MQAQFKQQGSVIDYTPGSAVSAGDVLVVNSKVVVAVAAIAANVLGSVATEGVFKVVKATGAITNLAAVYWDADGDPLGGTAGTGAFTTTSSGNTFAGYAIAAAAETDTTVDLMLVKVPSVTANHYGPLNNVIADPGDAGAIPVTSSGYCPIVTAGSETRTLAVPAFIGQELLLYIKTDGGTCVITVASAINQTGNNTITMADVRDVIRLVAIESGSNRVWHVVSNDGAALSTV
jgi:predicted RecA/RadA family phage recombinase